MPDQTGFGTGERVYSGCSEDVVHKRKSRGRKMVEEGVESGVLGHRIRKLPSKRRNHITGREVQNSVNFFSLRGMVGAAACACAVSRAD